MFPDNKFFILTTSTWKIFFNIESLITFFWNQSFDSIILNCKISSKAKFLSLSRLENFFWHQIFDAIFLIKKIFSDTKFFIQFFWIRKHSPTLNFLYYFFKLENFFLPMMFYNYSFSNMENFSSNQISNIIFSSWKIFSIIEFWHCFSNLESFFQHQIFHNIFLNWKTFFNTFFRLGKFFLTLDVLYLQFFRLANFLGHQSFNTILVTWKIFSDTRFLKLFFQLGTCCQTPNFLYL